MVLTFTGSLSVAEVGRSEIRAMLIGALGCNLAWGLIDGIMYLMACLSEQAQRIRVLRSVRQARDAGAAHRVISGALPPAVASALEPADFEKIYLHLNQLPEPAAHPRLRSQDWRGALVVFLLVFVSTLPVVLPFVVMQETRLALRVSNGIAMAMLFLTGYAFGRCAGYRPWLMGTSMVVLGGVLVGLTIALGG
ncbi:MAG TPA: VIT1/CCC1 transporter family protein [Verrucomicrobiota bacterium]|nr:VIT1/CCC1 transporter family protein [Verrucomicrobiota bacterium]